MRPENFHTWESRNQQANSYIIWEEEGGRTFEVMQDTNFAEAILCRRPSSSPGEIQKNFLDRSSTRSLHEPISIPAEFNEAGYGKEWPPCPDV